MHRLTVPGAQLHFATEGTTGPWVTLVNGYTRPMTDFKLLSKSLVQSGFRCLMFDNRGSGITSVERDFSSDEMASDIFALWRHLNIDRGSLLGISMGGVICQKAASVEPERITKLCLISTTCDDAFVNLITEPWGTDTEQIVERLRLYVTEGFFRSNHLLIEAMAKQISRSVETGTFEQSAAMQRAAFPTYRTTDILSRLKMPTLVIHGKEDRVIAPTAAEQLHRQLTNSKLVILEEAGHLLLAESSQALRREILDFLTSEPI